MGKTHFFVEISAIFLCIWKKITNFAAEFVGCTIIVHDMCVAMEKNKWKDSK